MKTLENLIAEIETFNDEELIVLHNAYCENTDNYDDIIYSRDDFAQLLSSYDPFRLISMTVYGHVSMNDEYWAFNGYDNIISFGYAEQVRDFISISDIARDILENPGKYEIEVA